MSSNRANPETHLYSNFLGQCLNAAYDAPGLISGLKKTTDKLQELGTSLTQTSNSIDEFVKKPELFFEHVVRGTLKGAGFNGAEADTQSSLFQRVKQWAIMGFSFASDALLEQVLEHVEAYDLDSEDQHFITKAKEDLKNAKEDLKKAQSPSPDAVEENSQDASKDKMKEKVGEGEGASADKILEKEEALKALSEETWAILNKYHITVQGVHVNVKKSSDEAMKKMRIEGEGSKNNDGVNPIRSLVLCQQSLTGMRVRYGLKPPPPKKGETIEKIPMNPLPSEEEIREQQAEEEETNQRLATFALETSHFVTMHTVHHLFQHSEDPAIFNKIIQEGGNIEKKYLKRFGKNTIKAKFYSAVYKLLFWLIEPVITDTLQVILVKLRSFLRNDVDVLTFAENMIVIFADYYGRVEKGRKDFLNPQRTGEAGIFEKYLEESIKLYDDKYTKQDVLENINKFIVQLIPRPRIRLGGHRIPLLSSFLDWIVHLLRKGVVKYVLRKTGIVGNLLTEGTNAAQNVQLAFKRILEKKLADIIELIDTTNSDCSSPDTPAVNDDLKHKKDRVISRHLHRLIRLHSKNLLNFLDIVECNQDERALRNMDNQVSTFATDFLIAIANILQKEPFFLRQILEDAATDIAETSLATFLDGKNRGIGIETQLQTLLEVFETSYTYVPEEERVEAEIKHRQDSKVVDENLNSLIEQLSRTAVLSAIDTQLKNATDEKHKSIKAYVENEKIAFKDFFHQLDAHLQQFVDLTTQDYVLAPASTNNQEVDSSRQRVNKLKIELSNTVEVMETYLRHISMQLRSPELEGCYSDVRGDLHNIYANVILIIKDTRVFLEAVAQKLSEIEKEEQKAHLLERCSLILETIIVDPPSNNLDRALEELKKNLPPETQAEIAPYVEAISEKAGTLQDTLYKITVAKASKAEREKLQKKLKSAKKRLKHIKVLEKQVLKLEKYRKIYYEIEKGSAQPLIKKIDREKILARAEKAVQVILNYPSKIVQRNLAYFLTADPQSVLPNMGHITKMKDDLKALKNYYNNRKLFLEGLNITQQPEEDLERLNEQVEDLEKGIAIEAGTAFEIVNHHFMETTGHLSTGIKSTGTTGIESLKILRTTLSGLDKHFTVKGCISIGEIKLYNALAPQTVAYVAPYVSRISHSIIDAMGTRVHVRESLYRSLNYMTAKPIT